MLILADSSDFYLQKLPNSIIENFVICFNIFDIALQNKSKSQRIKKYVSKVKDDVNVKVNRLKQMVIRKL